MNRSDRTHRLGGGDRAKTVAKGPVADLVMVLEKSDKRGWRQVGAQLATDAAPKGHQLPLKSEALRQRPAEPLGIAGVVNVIAARLASRRDVQGVMHIVVPLGGVPARLAIAVALQAIGLVLLVFQDQMDVPVGEGTPHPLSQFGQQVTVAVIEEGVARVEAKPVEVKLLQPI